MNFTVLKTHIKDTEFTFKIILQSEIAVSLFLYWPILAEQLTHFTTRRLFMTGQVKQRQVK